jgi:hypothetical protein
MSDITWPANGAVPVFSGDLDDAELVGFTTFTIPAGVGTFMMGRPIEGDPEGAFRVNGRALVIEREGPAGPYLAWLVVDGESRELPNFWPVWGQEISKFPL